MRFTRTTATLAVATVAILGLSACAGGGETPADTSDATLIFAGGEPDHLTPGRQTVAFTQVMSVFSPLVDLDEAGEMSFLAAENVESDDATLWTITLRDGWTFHNGEPVTSASYVDAWNYTALGANAWENSWELASIVGYDDLNPSKGEAKVTEMSGLKIIDDLTFTVELVGPDSQFPLQLTGAQTGFYPMPEAAYDDLEAYDRKPIGNGPFEMTEAWEDTEEYTVTAYADYPGEAPTVGGITFRPYTDSLTGYTDVLAGNADVLYLPTAKMTSAITDFGEDHVYSLEAPGVDYIGFPLWDEKWQNKELRQAISMAIDREAINEAIYGGLYAPAESLSSPNMNGDPAGLCDELCSYDPDAAKAKLVEAGGYEGEMTIVYPGGSGLDELFEAYANQIRQNLDIDAVASPTTDWAEYWQSLVDHTVAGPHFGHWGALYPSQQSTLRALFTEGGGCYLCTGYSSDEVDELLKAADASQTLDDSYEGYAEVQAFILEDFPTVPTFSNTYNYVTSDRVAELPAVSGSPVLSKIVLTD